MICPSCKKNIDEDLRECPNCGYNIEIVQLSQINKNETARKKAVYKLYTLLWSTKTRRVLTIIIPLIIIVLVLVLALGVPYGKKVSLYNDCVEAYEKGNYGECKEIAKKLDGFRDSEEYYNMAQEKENSITERYEDGLTDLVFSKVYGTYIDKYGKYFAVISSPTEITYNLDKKTRKSELSGFKKISDTEYYLYGIDKDYSCKTMFYYTSENGVEKISVSKLEGWDNYDPHFYLDYLTKTLPEKSSEVKPISGKNVSLPNDILTIIGGQYNSDKSDILILSKDDITINSGSQKKTYKICGYENEGKKTYLYVESQNEKHTCWFFEKNGQMNAEFDSTNKWHVVNLLNCTEFYKIDNAKNNPTTNTSLIERNPFENYHYDSTTDEISSGGIPVGEFEIWKGQYQVNPNLTYNLVSPTQIECVDKSKNTTILLNIEKVALTSSNMFLYTKCSNNQYPYPNNIFDLVVISGGQSGQKILVEGSGSWNINENKITNVGKKTN